LSVSTCAQRSAIAPEDCRDRMETLLGCRPTEALSTWTDCSSSDVRMVVKMKDQLLPKYEYSGVEGGAENWRRCLMRLTQA
jgi:hypothetical protein